MSGGGVRGLAHIGIIKALREHGIIIDHFSGVSAGALVAAMAAADAGIDDMLDFWTETDPFSLRHFAFGEPAIFHSLDYVDPLRNIIKHDTFESLPHRLTVWVTAMLSGKLRSFDSGPLWPIVVASACFPLVFSPVSWEGEVYMDGGIMDNFPVEPLADTCDFIIGVNVDPHRSIPQEDLKSMRDIVERVMDLRFKGDAEEKARQCDVIIYPPRIDLYRTFDTGAMLEIFQLGYEAGVNAIPEIKAKIAGKSA